MKNIRLLLLFILSFLCSSNMFGQLQEKQKTHKITLLGLGDSITEGGGESHSYLFPLWEKLNSNGYQVDFIGPRQQKNPVAQLNHAGYGGKNVEFLDANVDSIYQQYPADIVLIHAGHNHFVEEKPIAGMIKSYKYIVRKIQAINPDAIVVIAQVMNSGKLPKSSYIPQLNKEIALMVRRLNDPRIVLVDQSHLFNWQQHTIQDKVHPNEAGANLMADVWFDALVKILPTLK